MDSKNSKNIVFGNIVVNEGNNPTFNLGDYVQSLAAFQFLPNGIEPILLERDNISDFQLDGGIIKVIMNGWWMVNPENFPPSSSILPFYRSFHLRPRIEKIFFNKETIAHLKKHQPIGCRDENTKKMMQSHGIDAFFSGCLTLTLGQTFHYRPHIKSPIYIVDPFVGNFISKDWRLSLQLLVRCLHVLLIKRKLIYKVKNQILKTCNVSRKGYDLWLYSTKLCAIYSEVIGNDVLEGAIYRTHIIPANKIKSHKERLVFARETLEEYSKAKFVITSRIHCGLPCLGIGIPVILVVSPPMIRSGRMGGVANLFKHAFIKKGKCVLNKTDFKTDKIEENTSFNNYDRYLQYAKNLKKDCNLFIGNNIT